MREGKALQQAVNSFNNGKRTGFNQGFKHGKAEGIANGISIATVFWVIDMVIMRGCGVL